MQACTMIVLNNYYFRDGSIVAHVQLRFKSGVSDPLKPLEDQVNTGKLGPFSVTGGLIPTPSTCASFRVFFNHLQVETSISCLATFCTCYL